jgi:hypothetical protein
MRHAPLIAAGLIVASLALALAACSKPIPPQGHWQGAYDSGGTLVVARVEIAANGQVRLSAPDLTNTQNADTEQRRQMRERLAAELANGWDAVMPRPMDFDGKTFRKPGGIAPQMTWDKTRKQMTLVLYLGNAAPIYIPLQHVGAFSDNPWPTG